MIAERAADLIRGGFISGPRLNGRVMDHSGADSATVRTDGAVETNAHYMLEADDGAPIYIQNRGHICNAQPDSTGPAYFRCTPYFRAPVGTNDRLDRTVIVGGGRLLHHHVRPARTARDDVHALFSSRFRRLHRHQTCVDRYHRRQRQQGLVFVVVS